MPRVMYAFSTEEITRTGYACIVEGWDKVKEQGSRRRSYRQEFTEEERAKLTWLYNNRLYGWCLRTGVPEEVVMSRETFQLIQRAAGFFALL